MKIFVKIFLIAFVFFAVAMGAGLWTFSKIYEPPVSEGFDDESQVDIIDSLPDEEKSELDKLVEESKRINILLMGMEGPRTDTLILASFDPESNDLDLISIPRDTYYPRPGHDAADKKKINAAYGDDGAQGTMDAVSDILGGVPVHHYVRITYTGVARIVDSLGGVKINIPMDMEYDDPYDNPPLHIRISKGTQILNGEKAIQFLRFRKSNNGGGYPDGDLGRMKAQQQFVKSAMGKVLSFRLPVVANTAFNHIKTDMALTDILKFATDAVGMKGDNIKTYSLPGSATTKGVSYFLHDASAAEELVKQIYRKAE